MHSIKDVAEYCGVSKATVSNVINGKSNVSEKTAQRVREAMEHLGYYPNFSATTLAAGKTGIFGLFIGVGHTPYEEAVCSPLMKSLVMASGEKDMQMMIFYDVAQEKMKHMLSGKGPIDGAVIVAPASDDFQVENFREKQIQTVLIGTPSGKMDEEMLHVDVDNVRKTYEITSKLIEMGCEELLLLNSRADYPISRKRNEGFYRALKEHGLEASKSMVIHINDNPEEIYRTIQFFLETHKRCPGILNVYGGGENIVQENRDRELVVFDCGYDKADYETLGASAFELLYRAISGEEGLESSIIPHNVDQKRFLVTEKYRAGRNLQEAAYGE